MADNFVNSFTQGVETGSSLIARRRQLEMQERRTALEEQQQASVNALMPLRQEAMNLDNQAKGIELAQALQNKQYQVEINKAFLTAGDILRQSDPSDPATSMKVLDLLVRVPSAKSDPRFAAVMDALQTAQQLKMQKERLAKGDEQNAIENSLRERGLANQERGLDLREKEMSQPKSGMTVFDPATGNPIMTTGSVPALTVANQTRMQQSLESSASLVDNINQLEPLISSETFGVGSAIGGLVNDRLLAQFPGLEGLSSQDRAKAGPVVTAIRSDFLKSNRSDSNIGVKEVAAIESVIPKPGDPIDSPQRAKDTYAGLKRAGARKGAYVAAKLGQPVPDWSLNVLSPRDIVELNKAGMLSKEAALAALKRKGGLP